MSNVIAFPAPKEKDVYVAPEVAVMYIFTMAFGGNDKAKQWAEYGLEVAKERGFALSDMLIRYATNPETEANGVRALKSFVEYLPAEEFFTINGLEVVKGGAA